MESIVGELGTSRDCRLSGSVAPSTNAARESNHQPELPLDLREWVPSERLMASVQEELSAIGNSYEKAEVGANVPKRRLGVLAFGYLLGRFDTEEVVLLCQTEPLFHSLSEGEVMWPSELTQHRRRNRGLLIADLASVLGRAFREHFQISTEVLPSELKRCFHEDAVDRLDIARHMDRTNAD